MAASTVVRWVKVLVALVAVGLMLFGVVAILVGLLGRLSTGTGGLVPDGPAPTASVAAGDPVKVVSPMACSPGTSVRPCRSVITPPQV